MKARHVKARAGDLWALGRHRLLCGDATQAADVGRLLGRREPLLMVTDPPYGVQYDPTWRVKHDGRKRLRLGKIANDDRCDWTDAYRLFPGDVAYVWHGGLHARDVATHLRDCRFHVRAQIIWRKARLVFSRGHYHWQHEPCWYAVRKGRTARWSGDRRQRTVWDISMGEHDAATIHSAQKPVACMAKPIGNHGEPGDAVYDPFAGSGSTLIACELLDRVCLAIELSPAYCDVVIARWQQLTRRRAKRL